MTRTRYQILPNDQNPYFVTSTTLNWFPLFSNPNIANIIIHSLKFLMKNNRIVIYAYVLMENHIHLVAMAEDLSKELANFKSFTARRMIDFFKNNSNNSFLSSLLYTRIIQEMEESTRSGRKVLVLNEFRIEK
jgi:putative transposase